MLSTNNGNGLLIQNETRGLQPDITVKRGNNQRK